MHNENAQRELGLNPDVSIITKTDSWIGQKVNKIKHSYMLLIKYMPKTK